ncbi:MAG: hypothetical protein AMJ38_05495 [Dehalococcoidia bacterium DG_22]|nr:MAG: hypothetical protein AMJ38_05495 [Dehalococcoidia bacterium DG_22]
MPDKKRNAEEENLMNLLSAALKAPAAGEASAQPTAHRRWWPRLVAAAAVILVAVLGALWLLPSGPEPSAPGRLAAVTLPFPQLLAESARKLEQVETAVITLTEESVGLDRHREVDHVYYKSPTFWREESGTGDRVKLNDGKRFLLLDLGKRAVIAVSSALDVKSILREMMSREDWEAGKRQYADRNPVIGPFADTIKGVPCHRFEVQVHLPARGERPPKVEIERWWFAVESGLLLHVETSNGHMDFEYNVPLDDSLFTIPPWAQDVWPAVVGLRVQDEKSQPVADAKVYFGRLPGLKETRTDARGEADLDLEARAVRDAPGDNLIQPLWGDVIVESADRKLAGLYTFENMVLVLGEGLVVGRPEPGAEARRELYEEGSSARFAYDPETNVATLTLILRPRAEVFRSGR